MLYTKSWLTTSNPSAHRWGAAYKSCLHTVSYVRPGNIPSFTGITKYTFLSWYVNLKHVRHSERRKLWAALPFMHIYVNATIILIKTALRKFEHGSKKCKYLYNSLSGKHFWQFFARKRLQWSAIWKLKLEFGCFLEFKCSADLWGPNSFLCLQACSGIKLPSKWKLNPKPA